MCAVANRLQACENTEREENERQHHRKGHFSGQPQPAGRRGQRHRSQLQRQQMQAVGRDEAPLDFHVDLFAVFAGCLHGRNGGAALPKGLYYRKTANIFQRCRCQILGCFRRHGCVALAVSGDQQKETERQSCTCNCNQRDQRIDEQQKQENTQEVQISAHEVIHHAHAHVFQGVQARCNGVQDITCIHLLKIAEGHPFERFANGQPIPCDQLVADGFLGPGTQIIEQEAQQHQQGDNGKAHPDPITVKTCSVLLTFDQKADGIGRHHGRHSRKPGGKEGKHKADIEFLLECTAPVDDPFDRPEHLTSPPSLRQRPPSLSLQCGRSTFAYKAGRSSEAAPVCLGPECRRSSAPRCYLRF